VRLTVNGQVSPAALTVSNDPRSPVTLAELEESLGWQLSLVSGITSSHDAIEHLRLLRRAAAERQTGVSSNAAVVAAIQTFDRAALGAITTLAAGRALAQHLAVLEYGDMRPAPSIIATLGESCARVAEALARYRQVAGPDLARVNAALGEASLQALPVSGGVVGTGCGR
jgi:hypothetical protein